MSGRIEGGSRLNGIYKPAKAGLPLVSIITPVLNGDKYLEQALESVTEQSYENIEYIVVDGGSLDDSLHIIKRHDHKIDYWLSEKDRGLYDAINKGIELSTGEIIGILNSDDFYKKDAVSLVVQKYLEHKFEICICDTYSFIDFENYTLIDYKTNNVELIRKYPSINHPGSFVQRKLYEKTGLYNLKYKISADYDFLLKSYLNKANFYYIKKILVLFRHGGKSSDCNCNIENFEILKSYNIAPRFFYFIRFYKCRLKGFLIKHGLYKNGIKRFCKQMILKILKHN